MRPSQRLIPTAVLCSGVGLKGHNAMTRVLLWGRRGRMMGLMHYREWLLSYYWKWKLKFGNNTLRPLVPKQAGSVLEPAFQKFVKALIATLYEKIADPVQGALALSTLKEASCV